ncbi:toll/interleukin-1 receptor domain-containing protein [Cochleicola gelatinilyticus]|uniref:TIR domain-containing protein n=1 Tax=Cochleicola gelatinilyticus TaxID=1763537 RepID=A0A167JP10_9FLAO|nr:toll/interleukin-1 receptor domain-containing protein [Cochleicola gelatinilyticus]OAB80846.1 hypothetical protein ULVI_01920 [Cochleicola gelatinilyticus]
MTSENKTPTIFLSYSWSNKKEATLLTKDFDEIGIPLIKDTITLKYKDSLTDYMQSIRNTDFAIILLSDEYLKSQNCMFEAIEILKEQNHKEKILPILINNPIIFKAQDRIKYIKYWRNKRDLLKAELEELDVTSAIDSYNDLKIIEIIYSSIDSFLKTIGDLKTSTLEELKEENYKSIIEYLGFEDISFVLDLLLIMRIENLVIKEYALDKHIEKFGESSLAYYSIAHNKANLFKKEEAKFFYEKAIELNPNSESSWNNLGFLYDKQFKQEKKAMECYQTAIRINPNLIIARINLALIFSSKNLTKKAENQYLEILKINPQEPKAHNNIGNIYRGFKNKEKAIFHFKKAIEYKPDYAEAYLNLGNYYDIQLDEFEKAIPYYEKAKKIANNEVIDEIVDTMYTLKKRRE